MVRAGGGERGGGERGGEEGYITCTIPAKVSQCYIIVIVRGCGGRIKLTSVLAKHPGHTNEYP